MLKSLENLIASMAKTAVAVGTTATAGGFVAANDVAPHQPTQNALSAFSQASDLSAAPIHAKEDAHLDFNAHAIKEDEVDVAIDTVRLRAEELWQHMLPAGFDNRDLIFKAVREVVMHNPTLVLETRQNIANMSRMEEEAHLNPWNELKVNYPCDMCHDVLAAPVVLPCTHNFCGLCVHEMFTKCQSADIEVAHQCPVCGCESFKQEHAIYERTLDETIEREVRVLPECAEKREWQRRRHAYLLMKTAAKKEERFLRQLPCEIAGVVMAIAAIVLAVLFAFRR
eukprot:gene39608-48219_t